jgi:hypothetical protein
MSPGGEIQLHHYPEGAVVYLDHHALMNAAERHADELVNALAIMKSTLALSWVNFVQLSKVSDLTLEPVARLLGRIQPRLVFLDTNVSTVAEKEAQRESGQRKNPAYLHDEWADLVFHYGRPGALDPLDLPTFLESFKSPILKKSLAETASDAAIQFGEIFEDARSRMAADRGIRKRVYAAPPKARAPLAARIFLELVKFLVKNKINVRDGDNMNDTWHTNVPITYCDFVVLDKLWVRASREVQAQLRKINGLDWEASVFPDVPSLLPELRSWR